MSERTPGAEVRDGGQWSSHAGGGLSKAGAETRVKLTLRSAALTWGIETAVHSLCRLRFEMGMNAVGPVPFGGAPRGGQEPLEDLILLEDHLLH